MPQPATRRSTMRWRKPRSFCARFAPARSQRWCQKMPFRSQSLVNVATAPDGSPILLLSRLAAHTRHLASDPRLSLLLAQTGGGDPLAHPRVTIMGRGACIVEPDFRAALKARFLARHPESALYADFGDFAFWRVAMEQAHFNGGFARAGHFKAKSSRHIARRRGSLGSCRGASAFARERTLSSRSRAACGRGRGQARWAVAGDRD